MFADKMGDVEKGKKLFVQRCAACHNAEQGAKHKQGPNLFTVFLALVIYNLSGGVFCIFEFTQFIFLLILVQSKTTFAKFMQGLPEGVPGLHSGLVQVSVCT